jgi:hypothetical protein
MPSTASTNLGKTSFVKETLNDNPRANTAAVNEAWTAAGMPGTISTTLVNKMRSRMGLTGNLRARRGTKTALAAGTTRGTGKKRGRKPRGATSTASKASTTFDARGRKSRRSPALFDLEAEIDRLIFKVMGLGALTDVEDSLREARRRVCRQLPS